MLQWMGGSRRKVATSRKSTQKRQKQYFEQRKRQQQNLQMMGSDNCSDSTGTTGQNLKANWSLDILNFLNLSTNAQKCNSSCQKGMVDGENKVSTMPGGISTNQPTMVTNIDTTIDSYRFEEAREHSCCQIETSPKKVLASSPDHQDTAFNGPPSHWKTVTDQYSELSVIDLLCDDEANATVEKCPTCEDHVSFSLDGLGKVGTETPVHSPDQWARIPYSNSPVLKDGRKSKLKNLNHVLDDIELQVDTMMQDIKVSPVSSSNLPFNKVKQSLAIDGECKHYYDHANKNSSSINEEFFHKTENSNVDIWNGPLSSFSQDQLENDFDFYGARGARCSRLDGKFSAQNLVPEDVRDNSSLLSEESCSSTAVRGKAIKHSPPRIVLTGENRRKHRNIFPSPRNKCSTKEEKCRSMSNPSKRKSSHYSDSILQEELGAHNSWQFDERYASVDRSSVTTSFCQDLEANFVAFASKYRTEDPFTVFTNPELHNKASPCSGIFKNAAPLSDSPPCSFTSEKFAFAGSTAFPSFWSRPTSPTLSSDFQLKGKPQEATGVHCETSSTGMSVQGSVSKVERKVKLQKERCKTFEQEDIFMGDNESSPEKKMAGDASTSNNNNQECYGTEDTNQKTTQCLELADSPGHVEEISSSLKKADKHESKVDPRKSNYDAETPLQIKISKEEMKNCQPGRITVSGKNNNEYISLSGQVMFESYVFQLLCVQKVLKEACTTSRRNNAFLGPGSNPISHQT